MLHLGSARPWDPPVLDHDGEHRRRGRRAVVDDRGARPLGCRVRRLATRSVATASSGRSSRSAPSDSDSTSPARWTPTPTWSSGWCRGASTRTGRPTSWCVACATRGGVRATMPTEPHDHATRSGIPLDPVYDRPAPAEPLPGMYPFTRGPYASMYRGRLWTMRQFAGYGTPAETNERFRLLLERGQTGLSVAFDMPTLMGLDPDDPRSEGEVGRCGVAVATLDDTETLFAGIPLDEVSVSMTINGPAAWIFAVLPGRRRAAGCRYPPVGRHAANRHLQGVHGAEGVAVPAAAAPAARRRPHGVLRRQRAAVSPDQRLRVSHPRGGLDRRAGAGVHAGRRVRLRGARAGARAWRSTRSPRGCRSSSMRTSICSRRWRSSEPRGASGPGGCATATGPGRREAQRLRFHTQTAGVSLTAQQPMNNVVRTAIEALAAVLGGTQSLHTNALDEVLALPDGGGRDPGAAHATGARLRDRPAGVADPLGGSYFVESLTDEVERQAEELFAEIAADGGGVDARRGAARRRERLVHSTDRRGRLRRAAAHRGRRADPGRRERLRGGPRDRSPRPCGSAWRRSGRRSMPSSGSAPSGTRGRRPTLCAR